ncbi:MAG: type I 3-dehydroquinate dehydratase [Verrucomicrobiota bacterium]
MNPPAFTPADGIVRVVGSVGNPADLNGIASCGETCDVVEIRMDLLAGRSPLEDMSSASVPLLFTARRGDEGGDGNFAAEVRSQMLEEILDHAACVDIEVASIPEMQKILSHLRERGIPWIASFHDFEKLPDDFVLRRAETAAREAGAAVFKVAAVLHSPEDIARLARFQLRRHDIAAATMGMGKFAAVSRLLCAQCGSALNYGSLGNTPTAPGQWSAADLKRAIDALPPI